MNVSKPFSDYYISDHSFTTCTIEQCRPPLVATTVRSRNWKSVCAVDLRRELSKLNTVGEHNEQSVDEVVDNLTKKTLAILDSYAPIKDRTFVSRPTIPWYSTYLKKLKHYKRSIEKIYLRHRSSLLESVYKKVRNHYTMEVSAAKSGYYDTKINDAKGNVKLLYNVTSKLLGREKENPLPSHSNDVELANNFLSYFVDKIKTIRDQLDNTQVETACSRTHYQASIRSYMNQFELLSHSDVKKLILESKSTTCELDFIPTPKLKENVECFLPSVTDIVNKSLTSGVFPQNWKDAVIKPLLKKKGLSLELRNYRPVSNLSFLSKILEKAALHQITSHIETNNLLPSYQSAYRKNHGVETALIKMYDDLLMAVDQGQITIVVMIDLSAAFDTIDIPITLEILNKDFGINETPLQWIKSYLTNRTMKVMINSCASRQEELRFGVPQGSCAGPVIFTLYIAALNNIVKKYPAQLYGYADDHKIALQIQAGNGDNENYILQQLTACLDDISSWMAKYKLKMNNSKTEIIAYGTSQQLAKVKISGVNVGGCFVKCVDHVRDLGVIMDRNLNFDRHIRKKCQIAYSQLKNLKSIRKYLSKKSAEVLVHGLVHSHIDFCNGLFADIPSYQLDRLQKLQNHAARVVTNVYTQPSVNLLKSLHWLPVKARIMFKILVIMFRVIHGTTPVYIMSLFNVTKRKYSLRSSGDDSCTNFLVPRRRTKLADRSLSVVGPKWWNTLPNELKCISAETVFRKRLKTHLFEKFYA